MRPATYSIELGKRIEQTARAIGWEKAAAVAERSEKQLKRYTSGQGDVPVSVIKALAEAGNVSVDWLATGERAETAAGLSETQLPAYLSEAKLPERTVSIVVPRYEMTASAGPGNFLEQQEVVDLFHISADWLSRLVPPNAKCGFIEARGDSMVPTIRDRDLLLLTFDVSEGMVDDGGVFIITINGMIKVKRLQRTNDRSIRIISDNDRYHTETLTASEAEQMLTVNAKVVWSGGPLRD